MNPSAGANQFLFIPFSYSVIASSLAGAASVILPLLLDQDADFELHNIRVVTTADQASDIRPNNISLQVQDKNNGRTWSDALVPQAIYSAIPGGYPLQRPVLLARRSNLAITIQNLLPSTTITTIWIEFLGVKVLSYVGGSALA